jgi:hypothetical protein
MNLQQEYHFEFSVQQLENPMSLVLYCKYQILKYSQGIFLFSLAPPTRKSPRLDKVSMGQPVRGHLMKVKQFNHPVHCAICHGFIW